MLGGREGNEEKTMKENADLSGDFLSVCSDVYNPPEKLPTQSVS